MRRRLETLATMCCPTCGRYGVAATLWWEQHGEGLYYANCYLHCVGCAHGEQKASETMEAAFDACLTGFMRG